MAVNPNCFDRRNCSHRSKDAQDRYSQNKNSGRVHMGSCTEPKRLRFRNADSAWPEYDRKKQENGHEEESAPNHVVGLFGQVLDGGVSNCDPVIKDQCAKSDQVEQMCEEHSSRNVTEPAPPGDTFDVPGNKGGVAQTHSAPHSITSRGDKHAESRRKHELQKFRISGRKANKTRKGTCGLRSETL